MPGAFGVKCGPTAADISCVAQTYRLSRRAARERVFFHAAWFVFLLCCAIFFADPNYPLGGRSGAVVACVLIALWPAVWVTLVVTFEATLDEQGTCEFRALLRQRRVRVQEMRWIKGGGSTEDGTDDFVIRYDGGRVRLDGDAFLSLVLDLIGLNPAIKLKGAASALARIFENDNAR
jgi:hypothetical protein